MDHLKMTIFRDYSVDDSVLQSLVRIKKHYTQNQLKNFIRTLFSQGLVVFTQNVSINEILEKTNRLRTSLKLYAHFKDELNLLKMF